MQHITCLILFMKLLINTLSRKLKLGITITFRHPSYYAFTTPFSTHTVAFSTHKKQHFNVKIMSSANPVWMLDEFEHRPKLYSPSPGFYARMIEKKSNNFLQETSRERFFGCILP